MTKEDRLLTPGGLRLFKAASGLDKNQAAEAVAQLKKDHPDQVIVDAEGVHVAPGVVADVLSKRDRGKR